ncbi:hypothetical protein [Prosthecobacter sp.]|uniref:hypothetical protein n=1 Tax=Prosthecobacter sp. TaxID=1965333 RepID=UPI003782F4D0
MIKLLVRIVALCLLLPAEGAALSGTRSIGPTGDYSSIGVALSAIQANGLSGPLVLELQASYVSTVETFPLVFTNLGTSASNTLTLRPQMGAVGVSISGDVNAGLITLKGANYVTIDGQFAGSGRYLTFRNTSAGTSACTLLFSNDASSNTVKNCIVEGAGTSASLGVISFSAAVVTGNNNNLINGCQVRDLSTSIGVPNRLIGSASSSVMSSGNIVSNNELFNFNQQGIAIPSSGSNAWTISGNGIYEVNAATSANTGISLGGGGGHIVSGNYIHDLLTTSSSSKGISCSGTGSSLSATIKCNRITAFSVNAATTTVYGIYAVATAFLNLDVSVQNNQVILRPATSASTTLYGLYSSGTSNAFNSISFFYNSVVIGGSESGSRSSFANQYLGDAYLYSVNNNLFLNFRTGGTGSHYAFGIVPTNKLTISNNVYAGTGTVAGQFMSFNDFDMDFGTWKSYHFDANSQADVAGSGNFTPAMFVDAANGDLHLVPGGNPLVNATGIPVAGVIDDYDGDLRPSSTPNVGSDQQPFTDVSVSTRTTLTDGGSVGFGAERAGAGSYTQIFTVANSGNVDLSGLTLSLDGPNAADYSVSTLSAASIPAGGSSATFSVTFAPQIVRMSNATLHLSSNQIGVRLPFDINLIGAGILSVGDWRQQHFGTSTNSGDGADTVDYDHDGLPNLIEWACGLDPTAPSNPPATALLNGTNLEFTYKRDLSAFSSGTTFTVEWSDTLGAAWQSTGVSETVLSLDELVQQVKATLPAGTSGHRFVHLKVTAPP